MLLCHSPSLKEVTVGAQGRHQEIRTEAEAMEEFCFLVPHVLLSLLCLHNPDHLARGGTTESVLDPPTSIIN